MMKIVQLTDLHLHADREVRLKNVPTWATWDEVWADVRARHSDADLIVLTGDLAHDELPPTYLLLAESLGPQLSLVRPLPGNHDFRAGIRAAFPTAAPNDGCLAFAVELGDWQIIGLDTHVPGQVSGRVGREQLEWFAAQLSGRPVGRSLVFQHHPPVAVGTPWVDKLGLEDAAEYHAVVAAHPQVAAVFCGHVHQVGRHAGAAAPVFTSPSTAIQFLAGAAEFTMEPLAPGYRVVLASDAGFETVVERLNEVRFPPS